MVSLVNAGNSMKCRGIVYDVGLQFSPGFYSVDTFNEDQVRYDFSIISNVLGVNTIRIEGENISRLVAASKIAREYGLRVFFNPWLMGADENETVDYMGRAAKAAEELREEGVNLVFVAGCEYSLFSDGIFEGKTVNDRICSMIAMAKENVNNGNSVQMQERMTKLNGVLSNICKKVRSNFNGQVTYSSGIWEQVNWDLFDIVGVDLYRDTQADEQYLNQLKSYQAYNKPVYVMEVGCCAYKGAAVRGGGGFSILQGTTPDGKGIYENGIVPERSEKEQADYIHEQIKLISSSGIEGMFVYVFSFPCAPYRKNGFDNDMTSYSIVKTLPQSPARSRLLIPWTPKEAFYTIAMDYRSME